MKLSYVGLPIFLSTIANGVPNPHWVPGQAVRTQSGLIRGRLASEATQVSAYLGIPYAKPPIGDLRFEIPQGYESNQTIDGTKFGPSCHITTVWEDGRPANFTNKNFTAAGHEALDLLLETGDIFSEDCLTLNIWTKPQVGEREKAVMVWFYGGGFTVGRTSDPTYDAQFIVDQEDVIVVSINYRTTIFGFPGAPSYPANPGLLDQRLALHWIYANIASFGGSPSRITLFGHSAGAASIDFHSYVPGSLTPSPSLPSTTSDPDNNDTINTNYSAIDTPIPIAGLILQSGTTSLGVYAPEPAASSWDTVTNTLNCTSPSPSAVMACMRSLPARSIVAAIPHSSSPYGSAAFWPTIDNTTIFPSYASRAFLNVPLLIGNANFEAGYYRAMASLYDQFLPYEEWVGFGNATFACPAARRAGVSWAAGMRTWRYRYLGDFPSLALTSGTGSGNGIGVGSGSGAYHGSELPVLFGTLETPRDDGEREREREREQVGKYLRGAWGAFARDPEAGLGRYDGWPVYMPGTKTVVELGGGKKARAGVGLGDARLFDGGCA